MIDTNKLNWVICEYKKVFPSRWEKIKKKWQAPLKFLNYWDIDDSDFGDMIQYAMLRAKNVINKYEAPLNMLYKLINFDAEQVRDMFRVLYDKTTSIDCYDDKELIPRINYFIDGAKDLINRLNVEEHYQSLKVVSTYLYLRYPDHYYIYNYNDIKQLSQYLGERACIKKGATLSVVEAYRLLDKMAVYANQDQELCDMLNTVLTKDCYPDTRMKILTEDIAEFFGEHHS